MPLSGRTVGREVGNPGERSGERSGGYGFSGCRARLWGGAAVCASGRRGSTSAAPPGLPIIPDEMAPSLRLLTKGANKADQAEQDHNPRSASVRLRGAELIREWKDLA